MYRLLLKDKGQSRFSITEADQFLSEKAIQRRNKQGININETDLPIDPSYFARIRETGVSIVAHSKWVKTITVKTNHISDKDRLSALPFVDDAILVWKEVITPMPEDTLPTQPFVVTASQPWAGVYGIGFDQIALNNGNLLHEAGYKGQGMTIAVMDGGYHNVDMIDAFNKDQILEARTFSHEATPPFRIKAQHGTRVLSCMLSNKENVMIGTAPEASYYLFCTEVDGPEFPVEEDYWISAIEYADSIGVDIASTSLGYTEFPQLPEMSHTHEQLDGKTVLMSIAAGMAADKGILVLNAGGNEGNKSWRTISIPSDARNILTVGAVSSDCTLASFTPYGPTADNRIKPEITGVGNGTGLIASNGTLVTSNGTSYSTPVMAGLTACLWQALPSLTNKELINIIIQSSHKYSAPDNRYGYGIPDVFKAYEKVQSSIPENLSRQQKVLIRPIGNYLLVDIDFNKLFSCKLTVYNALGKIVEKKDSLAYATFDISHLSKGIYIALLEGPEIHQACKFVKH